MERRESQLDPTLYEPIDGREALIRIANGLEIFNSRGTRYFFDKNGIFSEQKVGKPYADFGQLPVSVALDATWYIRRVFNVREQLLKHPDKWIGKFKRHSDWRAVKFDSETMRVVNAIILTDTVNALATTVTTYNMLQDDLDKCIPLNYVRPSREVNAE